MNLDTALDWAAQRSGGVLITIRADGRPQSSDIVYDVEDGVVRVSVTDDRAKTRNMRRDNRVVLHITDPAAWSYVSFDGTVELTPVASEPGDTTCRALAEQYETVAGGPHDDWDEFFRAMVDDRRLLVRFTPTSAVGQVR